MQSVSCLYFVCYTSHILQKNFSKHTLPSSTRSFINVTWPFDVHHCWGCDPRRSDSTGQGQHPARATCPTSPPGNTLTCNGCWRVQYYPVHLPLFFLLQRKGWSHSVTVPASFLDVPLGLLGLYVHRGLRYYIKWWTCWRGGGASSKVLINASEPAATYLYWKDAIHIFLAMIHSWICLATPFSKSRMQWWFLT